MTSPARALEVSFGPIDSVPTIRDATAGTVPVTLVSDLTDAQHHISRRIMIYNRDSVNEVSLLLVARGASLTGKTVADGIRVPPREFRQIVVTSRLRVGIVASAGTPAYNAVISDT